MRWMMFTWLQFQRHCLGSKIRGVEVVVEEDGEAGGRWRGCASSFHDWALSPQLDSNRAWWEKSCPSGKNCVGAWPCVIGGDKECNKTQCVNNYKCKHEEREREWVGECGRDVEAQTCKGLIMFEGYHMNISLSFGKHIFPSFWFKEIKYDYMWCLISER